MDRIDILNRAMTVLDRWVESHGTRDYIPNDYYHPAAGLCILPIFGMQQNRKEIQDMTRIILEQEWYSDQCCALEIGLGHFGSSHVLWREIFAKITTVEINHQRVNRFAENYYNHHGQWLLDDGKSNFVIGSSQNASSVCKVYDNCTELDFLFIDGDHSYECVLSDWLLYAPLVKPGGIVAFDDSRLESRGVPKLLSQLRQGFLGRQYSIIDIVHSHNIGISFYRVC